MSLKLHYKLHWAAPLQVYWKWLLAPVLSAHTVFDKVTLEPNIQ